MNKTSFSLLFKGFTTLFTGQTIASLLGLFSAMMLTRFIGFDKYGILALSIAYINIFNLLFNFQSFNALIKFGQDALVHDKKKLKYYVEQALFQDIITAILAFVFSLALAPIIGEYFQWDNDVKVAIVIMTFSIPFNVTGSFVGLLRLFGRYQAISINMNIAAFIKFISITFGVFSRYSFQYFIYIELASLLTTYILNYVSGIRVMKANGIIIGNILHTKFDLPFLKFNFYNNIILAIDLPTGEITKVIINQFLGSYELGMFNLFQKICSLVYRISDPISIVLYPELAKMVSMSKINESIHLTVKIVFGFLFSGMVILIIQYVLFDQWWSIVSTESVNAFVFMVYFFYVILSASTAPLHHLFNALNLIKYTIPILLISNTVYFILLFFSTSVFDFGIKGFIFALIIQAMCVVVLKVLTIKHNHKKLLI